MSDKIPLYVFVANEPVQIGTLVLDSDGRITGSMTQMAYDTLKRSNTPWFFALHPERQ